MKVAFRADASLVQGTGHVVRSLTLAREFQKTGHETTLISSIQDVPWLSGMVDQSGINWHTCDAHRIDQRYFQESQFDLLVVDSYEIPASTVNATARFNPVLAIVDNSLRDLTPSVILDHNIGAEAFAQYPAKFQLIGPTFALVRPEIVEIRRQSSARLSVNGRPTVLVMVGGSDPTKIAIKLGQLLSGLDSDYDFKFVTSAENVETVAKLLPRNRSNIFAHTPHIQDLLRTADLAVSAAGTSTLDLSCIGIPTTYISVADNQNSALHKIEEFGLGLSLGLGQDIELRKEEFIKSITLCAHDDRLRETIFQNSQKFVDGLGASRVVEFIRNITL